MVFHFIRTSENSYGTVFGENNIVVQPQTLKLSIEVINWPFQSIRNQIELVLEMDSVVCFNFIL